MSPCNQEMGGGNTQSPEDKTLSLREEEERNGKNTADANKEAVKVESPHCPSSFDADKKCFQPDSEREEEEQVEQPGRLLSCLEIPDFLLPDASEDNSGEHSIASAQ